MESKINDAKESENKEAEQALPGVSDTKESNNPVDPLQEHPSLASPVPLEANSIPCNSRNKSYSTPPQLSPSSTPNHNDQGLLKPASELPINVQSETPAISDVKTPTNAKSHSPPASNHILTAEPTNDVTAETSILPPKADASAKSETFSALQQIETNFDIHPTPTSTNDKVDDSKSGVDKLDLPIVPANGNNNLELSIVFDDINFSDGNESGTEEEQAAFMKKLEIFYKERNIDFKPPKFYGGLINCLKLWRAVTRLGGYDKVTSCKLWRQVGESFNPPKTCTTVSWTFRGFYEKALLDYERYKTQGGELNIPTACQSEPMNNQASGSGREMRGAAKRAMRGWHSRHLRNGEVSDPIIKAKSSSALRKQEKQIKSLGLLKRKRPSYLDHSVKAAVAKIPKAHVEAAVVDIGPPADWVKINVQKTKDCFEVYALVPGLLREEVRVQSDPAGRLVISGEPEHPDNPWGVTAFKKVVSLPSRIDPHQTSAVVTLHGQLFVRVPFEQV